MFGNADYVRDKQSKLAGEVVIGEFRFDRDTLTLFKGNDEFVLEPKVGSLLTYLLQHNNKHVSLKELHAEVWADTVVSDTAVRRAISKLRNVFGDSPDNPKYIKSLPKRGYRLIALPPSLSEPPTHKISDPAVIGFSGGKIPSDTATVQLPTLRFPFQYHRLFFIVVALLILSITAVLYAVDLNTSNVAPPPSSIAPFKLESKIATFKSDKLAMAVSSSKTKLAFSARNSESAPYKLYLKDLDKDSILQLSDEAGQVDFMTFVNNDEQIVYGVMQNNVSRLMLADVSKDNPPEELLIHQNGFIGDIASIPGQQSIVVALGSEEPAYSSIYKIDLQSGAKTELTTAVTDGTWDYLVQPSPDGRVLAFARWANNVSQLMVIDIETGSLLQTKTLPRVLYSISWRDDSHILILDRNYLKQMNIDTATIEEVALNPHGSAREILTIDYDNAMLLVNTPREVSVGESDISSPDSFIWLKSVSPGRVSTFYSSEKNGFISLENAETGTNIVFQNNRTGERTVLLHSERALNLFSVGREREELLYSEQGQLWYMDIATSTKKPITNASQLLLDAHLAPEDEAAYYCERRQKANSCYIYDLNTEVKKLLTQNVNILRPIKNGFIVARPDGQIEAVDKQFNLRSTLPFNVFYHTEHHLEVSDDYVVWSALDTNFNQIITHIYNQTSKELKTEHSSYGVMSAKFDLSPDGKRILRNTRTIQYSEFYNLALR